MLLSGGARASRKLLAESRVTLADARDPLGIPRIRLDWRLTDLDYRTMREACLALGAHVAEQGLGRIRIDDWILADDPVMPGGAEGNSAGGHHLCTTRMSEDPRTGVVDADCRVHGMSNLYVGGSSVFATAGYANPTYTIVKLALRLGDHVAASLA